MSSPSLKISLAGKGGSMVEHDSSARDGWGDLIPTSTPAAPWPLLFCIPKHQSTGLAVFAAAIPAPLGSASWWLKSKWQGV